MQRVLVVDDDRAVTSLLKRGLSYEGFAVETASSGPEALAAARERPPDAVVLDVMMPEMSGLEVLQRLRAADGTLPIVMLTAKDAPADQVQGLAQGADDYLVKPFNFDVLAAHVRAVLRRREAEHPAIVRYTDLSLDTGLHRAQRGDRVVELTTTEYQLLTQFLTHPERVLPKEFLMDRVWGYDFGGNANVLETYVKQLRQKLEAAGEPRLIHTLRGAGYVLREDA